MILDASAMLAFLGREPGESAVAAILANERTAMSAVNVGEVADVLVRSYDEDPERVEGVLGSLLGATIEIEEPSLAKALEAGMLRARVFDRRRRRVSLADCFVIVTAADGDAVVTTDATLAEVARAEGLAVIALPDSEGHRP